VGIGIRMGGDKDRQSEEHQGGVLKSRQDQQPGVFVAYTFHKLKRGAGLGEHGNRNSHSQKKWSTHGNRKEREKQQREPWQGAVVGEEKSGDQGFRPLGGGPPVGQVRKTNRGSHAGKIKKQAMAYWEVLTDRKNKKQTARQYQCPCRSSQRGSPGERARRGRNRLFWDTGVGGRTKGNTPSEGGGFWSAGKKEMGKRQKQD